MHYFQFSSDALAELRDLLGERLNNALQSLELAAGFCESGKRLRELSRRGRQELRRLEKKIATANIAIATLSPEATRFLQYRLDWSTSVASNQYVSSHWTMLQARQAGERARVVVVEAQKRPRNSMGVLLAAGVAGALSHAGVPLSKSRDGLFAKVLGVVWHDVDARAPEEVFRYVRAAVDIALRQDPHVRAPKGRPRKVVR